MTARSLVLVTVDCLRADHVGFLGYPRATTPFLDSLAAESFTFANAIAIGVPTYYSFPGILASRYPLALGRDIVGLAPGEANLASALRDAGHATAAFIAGNPYLSRRFGYDHGFSVFEDFLDDNGSADVALTSGNQPSRLNRTFARLCQHSAVSRRVYDEIYFEYCQRFATTSPKSFDELRRFPTADVLVDRATTWIRANTDRPFFLWIHLMDPHAPYYPQQQAMELMKDRPPSPARGRYVNARWNQWDVGEERLAKYRDEIIRLYDAGIRWADEQIARLVHALQGSDRWHSCVLAATADHGEEFLDHGGRYHPPSVREELIRVPLLLRVPGVSGRTRLPSAFSLLHLAPTLLECLEIATPPTFQGSSYWPHLVTGQDWDDPAITECVAGCTNPFRAEALIAERILAVRENRFKLTFDFRNQQEQLFNLDSDPAERHPFPLEAEKPTRQRLLTRAYQHLTESHQLRHSSGRMHARLRDIRLELASPAQ